MKPEFSSKEGGCKNRAGRALLASRVFFHLKTCNTHHRSNDRAYDRWMDFRLATLGDADLGTAQNWVKAYYALDGLEFNESVSTGIATLLASPQLGHFWEIRQGDQPVGYIVLTFAFDHEFGGKLGVVTDFFLNESARGSGLGTAVLSEVMKRAKALGCRHLELAVLDHNDRADKFYRRLGFEPQSGRRIFATSLV